MNRPVLLFLGVACFAAGCSPLPHTQGARSSAAAQCAPGQSAPGQSGQSAVGQCEAAEPAAVDAQAQSDGAPGAAPEATGHDAAQPAQNKSAPTKSALGNPSELGSSFDDDDDHGDIADEIEEDDEDQLATPPRRAAAPHPLDGVSDAEILRRLKEQPAQLGSMSIGLPNGGVLINAVAMPEDSRWTLVDPSHAYGTQESVDYLVRAMGIAAAAFPDTPAYFIGHLSARSGGYLKPHRSHQSGRDVDIGYVYQGGGRWYQRATETSLDVARTWALVRALVTETDPQFILIDHSIQHWLYEYAVNKGENRAWVDDLFKGTPGVRPALIRHVKGHATHLHVRFWNPIAEQTARRSYSSLVRLGRISPPTHFVTHKAKKGETLIHLAKRYGTTVRAIKQANGLRSNKIMARKQYRIPQKGVSPMGPRIVCPERRLPPAQQTVPVSAVLDRTVESG